jgi:hypothetical protein
MRSPRAGIASFSVAGALAIAACSTSSPLKAPAHLTCTEPGEATPGPMDMHCVGAVQPVNQASCFPEAGAAVSEDAEAGSEGGGAGDDAGPTEDAGASSSNGCAYGPTMFGPGTSGAGAPMVVEGDDDDCKYHVSWTSTPICASSTLGVYFTVTVTYLGTNTPVTDIPAQEGILPEAFIPTALDAACDIATTHISPTPFDPPGLLETSSTSGIYVGPVIFDQSGEWTLRFHIHEECSDMYDDSPHGHAAFHITVP